MIRRIFRTLMLAVLLSFAVQSAGHQAASASGTQTQWFNSIYGSSWTVSIRLQGTYSYDTFTVWDSSGGGACWPTYISSNAPYVYISGYSFYFDSSNHATGQYWCNYTIGGVQHGARLEVYANGSYVGWNY